MGALKEVTRFNSIFRSTAETSLVDAEGLAQSILTAHRVEVPASVRQFWQNVGVGYFGDRELLFFGEEDSVRGVISWNREEFWSGIQPEPAAGGCVFFAENPFGEQLGFRWLGPDCQIVLFLVDSMELFVVCEQSALFEHVLVEKGAITDIDRLHRVRATLGIQPLNTHYAPIVSPLIGGSDNTLNFEIESPRVHFATAIETWRRVRDVPTGTPIVGLDIQWEDEEG